MFSSCHGSRIATTRRAMVLELPRAGALLRDLQSKDRHRLARSVTPTTDQAAPPAGRLSRSRASRPAARLSDPFQDRALATASLRPAEGDDNLVLWDFHDLLFHTRSTEGRHANPLGGLYPYAGIIAPLPAVRPRWPGKKIDLRKFSPHSEGAGRNAPARAPFDTHLR